MSKRYFLSHAAADKDLVLQVKEALDDDAWVDIHEIDVGRVLLEEIAAGIEGAAEFVLFWSRSSSTSRWVQFEFNMAFIRWLEDNATALRIVVLDETPVPLQFRPFLQARNAFSAAEIASCIRQAEPLRDQRRRFFNRHVEIGRIEECLYSESISSVWIHGLPGAGKRALAAQAVSQLTLGTGTSKTVKVTDGILEPELNLIVASLLGMPQLRENSSAEILAKSTNAMIASFAVQGGIWIFEDAEHWLEDDATPGRIAHQVLQGLQSAAGTFYNHLAIFTSRRRPRLADESNSEVIPLRGLTLPYAVPLLRARGARATDDELHLAARELHGHPLALEIVASRLPMQQEELAIQRQAIATDLIDQRSLESVTWELLEVLAVADGPLPNDQLASFMGIDANRFQGALDQAVGYSLVELSDLGFLVLHPLVHDYFQRSFRKRSNYQNKTSQLADISGRRLASLTPNEPQYVQSLISTVKLFGIAGRYNEARELHSGLTGTLLSTANQLYREKRYGEALNYIEEALTDDLTVDRDALLLKAKTLAYLGRVEEARSLCEDLLSANPNSPKVLRDRGRIEFIDRRWTDAISFYRKSLKMRSNNSQVWVDIAQSYTRMEKWEEANAAAKRAIDGGGDTAYALALYSQTLEHLGHYEDAEKLVERAIKREPNNPAFYHRLGRISQLRGKRNKAIEMYRKCVSIDPSFGEAWVSIGSLQAENREFEDARAALRRAGKLPGTRPAVVDNVNAKLELLSGNLEAAQRYIDAALAVSREAINLVLAVRIYVAQAEAGVLSTREARANVRLLANELDDLGRLADVYDVAESYPKYFE